jgi:hypothetical protein
MIQYNTVVLTENMSQSQFFNHMSLMDWPGIEPGPVGERLAAVSWVMAQYSVHY